MRLLDKACGGGGLAATSRSRSTLPPINPVDSWPTAWAYNEDKFTMYSNFTLKGGGGPNSEGGITASEYGIHVHVGSTPRLQAEAIV